MKNPIFEKSYRKIFGDKIGISERGEVFFQDFYATFTQCSREISEMFAQTDMKRQVTMVKASLYQMVTFYATGILTSAMRATARAHEDLDIAPELYDVWLDCLIKTAALHDPEFDDKTELAWRLALSPGITFMKLSCTNSIRPLHLEEHQGLTMPRSE